VTTAPTRPRKTRELHNHHFDSTIWNDLQFRDDDIIIATYAKSGTTWMQQIVGFERGRRVRSARPDRARRGLCTPARKGDGLDQE
jgi:hypothetical protein